MSRTRTRVLGAIAAVPFAAILVLGGAGAASATNNGAIADHGSSATAVSAGQGSDVSGYVDGAYNQTQQTATGDGASNSNNTLQNDGGVVFAHQSNTNINFGDLY
jgi:hypothetical protein